MINKVNKKYTLSCDICHETANETFYDFYDAVNFKKESGWKSKKDENGEWMDVCPECEAIK